MQILNSQIFKMKIKKRNILGKEWTSLRVDIERAKNELVISDNEFRELKTNEWELVQSKILKAFLYDRPQSIKRSWLWDDLKVVVHSIGCITDPYEKLNLLIQRDAIVYFFVNETMNEQTKYWYYQGNVNSIISIIGEIIGLDEYYIVSKKYDWLLCTNHHDVLIGAGSIIPKMKENEEKIKAENTRS